MNIEFDIWPQDSQEFGSKTYLCSLDLWHISESTVETPLKILCYFWVGTSRIVFSLSVCGCVSERHSVCRAQSVYCGNEERSVVSLLFTATSPAACAYVGSACTPGSWCLEKTHTLRFNHTWTVQVLESHMRTIFPKPTLSSRILYLVFPFSLFPSLPVLLPVSHPFTFHLTSLSV